MFHTLIRSTPLRGELGQSQIDTTWIQTSKDKFWKLDFEGSREDFLIIWWSSFLGVALASLGSFMGEEGQNLLHPISVEIAEVDCCQWVLDRDTRGGTLGQRMQFLTSCGIADTGWSISFMVLFRCHTSILKYFHLLQFIFCVTSDLRFICGLFTLENRWLYLPMIKGNKGKIRGKGFKRRKTEGSSSLALSISMKDYREFGIQASHSVRLFLCLENSMRPYPSKYVITEDSWPRIPYLGSSAKRFSSIMHNFYSLGLLWEIHELLYRRGLFKLYSFYE